ncbi:ABC transporter permease [Oribacterium sp. C9]|nr:ABC transporter permease [Oribacterium sp. C9]
MRRRLELKNNTSRYLATPYIIWIVGFIVIPLLTIVYYGFTDRNNTFTLNNIAQILVWENYRPLYRAMILSAVCTAICFLLAFPLTMILRSLKVGRSSLIVFVFILPMWMNSLLRVLAWQTLLERKGVINGILTALHLPEQHLINTTAAVLIGMVYDFLPFMILPLFNALMKIDDNTINAAYDLGASYWQTLTKIILPLSVPGIVSGVTMVFVPALTTFAISNMLGGGKIYLIGNVIEQEFMQDSDWNEGSGLSLVLMIFVIVSMLIVNHFDDKSDMRKGGVI